MSLIMQLSGVGRAVFDVTTKLTISITQQHKAGFAIKNPGISARLRAISEEEKYSGKDIEDLNEKDIEDIDELENDFMNVGEVYDAHMREQYEGRQLRRFKIVERKFFKPGKQPNLLTWEEKEQIRFLHNSDPEKWDLAALAECFPVTESSVKKILRAKWQPESEMEIVKHNESVKRNWKLLEQRKLDIDENLKAHIEKFTSRKAAILPAPSKGLIAEAKKPMQTQSREFVSTVEDYVKKKLDGVNHSENSSLKSSQGGISQVSERKDSEVRNDYISTSRKPDYGTKMNKIQKSAHKNRNDRKLQHPEESDTVKQEAMLGTYCVGDSHYDTNDGEFLFRVPGFKY